MVKCGKGCMPECEYFTTGGCISPFNCPYKIETGYINTATSVIGSYTQGKDDLNEHKIKKWFRSLVDEGKIQQEPMNYDAATLQIYIDHLEKENAALRERLEKAVELPVPLGTPILKVWENRVPTDWTRMSFVNMWEITTVNFKLEHFPLWGKFYFPDTEEGKEAALTRLAELKGGKE